MNTDCSQDKLEIQGNEPFKIILIGDSGVGKTHLVNQYVKGSIPKNVSPTIGVEFATKLAKIDNEDVKAQFWDTGGQERYRSITSQHYRKSAGALIVYDITKQQSFDNVQKWADDLKYQAEPDIKIILVGNKLDLVNNKANLRKVKKEDAQKFASSNGMKFIECSAIKNQAVTQAFEDLLKEVARAKKKKGGKTSTASSPIKISTETNSSTTKCKCCPTN